MKMIGCVLFGMSLFFISCDTPKYIYEESNLYPIEHPWTFNDTVIYRFEIKDTNRYYNLLLEVDHDKNYAFENLYVKFETLFPDAKVASDLVSISLADAYGAWYSDCRGKTCTFYLTMQEQVIFAKPGPYQITLLPWMRSDTIKDIYRVAFRVEKDDKR